MRIRALTALLITLSLPAPLLADTSFESAALAQLTCASEPDPLPLLESLEAMGKLDPATLDSMDSVSCFPITDGIELAGHTFTSICAFEDDPDIRAKRPDLLVRAPGTAPFEHVSFGSDEALADIKTWYTTAIGPKHLTRAFETAEDSLDGKTHVVCSAMFPH